MGAQLALGGCAAGSDWIPRNVWPILPHSFARLFPYWGLTGFMGSAVAHWCHFQPRQLTPK